MIRHISEIAAIISWYYFENLNRTYEHPKPRYTASVIADMAGEFYSQYRNEIENGTDETWIHVFQNEGVQDYPDLIKCWFRDQFLERYTIVIKPKDAQ